MATLTCFLVSSLCLRHYNVTNDVIRQGKSSQQTQKDCSSYRWRFMSIHFVYYDTVNSLLAFVTWIRISLVMVQLPCPRNEGTKQQRRYSSTHSKPPRYMDVDCVWNVMAHAQKPDFFFRRNGRVHLNRRGRQFSRLLAAEVCASAVVMLDTPCSEVM